MTTLIAELYDALKEAGASDEKVRKASESSVAAYETRFAALDVKLERVDGRLNLLTWMVGATFAAVMSLVIKTFF